MYVFFLARSYLCRFIHIYNSNPVKHKPYLLNPIFREKVKKVNDRMLVVGLILPVDEAEWITLIVIYSKKGTDDIIFCVDY